MLLKIITLYKYVDTVLFGNHGLSVAVESVILLIHPYVGRISHYLSQIYESSTCNVYIVSCICRKQLLKECHVTLDNSIQICEKFWSNRFHSRQQRTSTCSLVHKLYGMGSETRLNFLKCHLGEWDPTPFLFSGENWFQFVKYVKSQNNRFPTSFH